jgi:hypothetical protein
MIVNDAEAFEDSLGINTSISGGWGPFGASAKAEFKKKCKVSRQATFCVLRFSAVNAFRTFTDEVRLSADADELIRLGDMKRFGEVYGDRFLSGGFDGGEFYGAIRIESEAVERQTEIAVQVKASFGLFKASGKVDSTTAAQLAKERIEINVLQMGGDIVPVFSLQELFDQARTVAHDVAHGKAVPISFTVEPYDALHLPGDNVSVVQAQHAKEVMRKLGEHYNALLELQNDIDFVLRNQDFFVNPKIDNLNKANQQITKALNKIVAQADACARDFSQCELFTPNIPEIDLPERKVKSKAPRPIRGGLGLILRQQVLLKAALVHAPEAQKRVLQAEIARLEMMKAAILTKGQAT